MSCSSAESLDHDTRFLPGSLRGGVPRWAKRRAGQPRGLWRLAHPLAPNQCCSQCLHTQPYGDRVSEFLTIDRRLRETILTLAYSPPQVAYESRSHLRSSGLSSSLPGSSGGKPWVSANSFTSLGFRMELQSDGQRVSTVRPKLGLLFAAPVIQSSLKSPADS